MKKIIAGLAAVLSIAFCYAKRNNADKPIMLPSKFINGERFYFKMASTVGDTLLGYGDSGGGISMLAPNEIERLNLKSKVRKGFIKHIAGMKYIEFDKIIADKNIPAPLPSPKPKLTRHFKKITKPCFIIPGNKGEFKELVQLVQIIPFDIFLAQNYFMGKSWTFDYPKQQIWVNTPLFQSEIANKNVQKSGFKKDDNGEKLYGHPSMKIEVDGDDIDVLFDTGATIILSDNGKKGLNTKENTIGGSFIAKSVFDKWRLRHPEWKYFEKADRNADMIEVPLITMSGHTIGPVLFAERPDEVWSQGMLNSMDKVVKGAIGGSALKYLKVTIDYNSELIKFE
jgi:hypothetical protein